VAISKPRQTREIKRTIRLIGLFLNKKRYHPRGNVHLDVVVHADPSQNPRIALSVVFNVALYLHRILQMAFTALKEPFPDELSAPLERILAEVTQE
jgi:hypothetical protein